nr:hypothetical protein [Fusobacterium gastrosuis]
MRNKYIDFCFKNRLDESIDKHLFTKCVDEFITDLKIELNNLNVEINDSYNFI